MPIPKLAYMPSWNSQAALLTIFSLILAAADMGFSDAEIVAFDLNHIRQIVSIVKGVQLVNCYGAHLQFWE